LDLYGHRNRNCFSSRAEKVRIGSASMKTGSALSIPETEGIKYAGSKLKLLPYILELVCRVKPNTILDGFAGTTRVSQAFAKSGFRVTANDAAVWSKVFGLCFEK
jgi:hypothetical protein